MTDALVPTGQTLPDILTKIVRNGAALVSAAPTTVVSIPKRIVLSDDERAAISALPAVLESGVVPDTKRVLSDGEVADLIRERIAIDAASKAIDRRKKAQKTAIFNHLDVLLGTVPADATVDDDGHIVVKGAVEAEGVSKKFTREIRSGSPTITADDLKECVSHEDYLACTTAVRVIDENKMLLHLRNNPDLAEAIAGAISVAAPTASLYLRNA